MDPRSALRSIARFVLCRVGGPYAAGAVEDWDVTVSSSPALTEYVVPSVTDAAAESFGAVAVQEPEVFRGEEGSEVELSSQGLSCTLDFSAVEDLGEEEEMFLTSTPLSSTTPADCTLGPFGVEDSVEEVEMFLTPAPVSPTALVCESPVPAQTAEVETCTVVQSPISDVPVVRTRSGRVSRRPDRYGDWLYY